jgi:hypothetical protein
MFDVSFFREYSGFTPSSNKSNMYDFQRSQITSQANNSFFDIIGGIGSKLSNAWAARDYADQVAEAKAISYQNAQVVAEAQKEYNLKAAEFQNELRQRNSNILMNNAYNLRSFALQEKEDGFAYAMRVSGDYKAEFASSGVQLNTGSTRDVENFLIDSAMTKSDRTYKDRLNQISEVVNKAQSEALAGTYELWSAKERNRFIDANAQMVQY